MNQVCHQTFYQTEKKIQFKWWQKRSKKSLAEKMLFFFQTLIKILKCMTSMLRLLYYSIKNCFLLFFRQVYTNSYCRRSEFWTIFWHVKFISSEKATKFCEISSNYLSYVVSVKYLVKILQNFVAFSECMNFNPTLLSRSFMDGPKFHVLHTNSIVLLRPWEHFYGQKYSNPAF